LDEFRELPEHQLSALGDDDLVAYMRAAREAGRAEAMKPAIGILVFGYWDSLVNRARLKLPEADAEDVASEAVASAIASAFDGRSIGEFRSWLHTILSRRIADYHESRKRRPKTSELPDEPDGPVAPQDDALFATQCLEQAYDAIANERHRRVIDLYVFGELSAAATAAELGDGMSETNVYKIASRFRECFDKLFEGDTQG
jgi:RNA polymerase sigma factor (sigma-70 family)